METTMVIILACIGAVVLLIVLALVLWAILYQVSRIFERYYDKGCQYQYGIERQRLHEASYWFSEDPVTMHLLSDLADMGDLAHIRVKWRDRIAEAEARKEE